jgi:hypothetical protein
MNNFIYPNEEGPQRKKVAEKRPSSFPGGGKKRSKEKGYENVPFSFGTKKNCTFFFCPGGHLLFPLGTFFL